MALKKLGNVSAIAEIPSEDSRRIHPDHDRVLESGRLEWQESIACAS
jgi:hypothetical protein